MVFFLYSLQIVLGIGGVFAALYVATQFADDPVPIKLVWAITLISGFIFYLMNIFCYYVLFIPDVLPLGIYVILIAFLLRKLGNIDLLQSVGISFITATFLRLINLFIIAWLKSLSS